MHRLSDIFGRLRQFVVSLRWECTGIGGARRTVACGRLVGSSVGWLARYAACNDWVHCGQVEAAFKRRKRGRNPSKEPGREDISGTD